MKTTDLTNTREMHANPELRRLAQVSGSLPVEGKGKWTRVEDTIEFAHRMGYKRIGLAFCGGLKREAAMLLRVLEANGLDVVSVICKTGGISAEELGIPVQKPGTFYPMCNPIAQAKVLNASKTDFNILFGLCVGHDSLFIKHSDALVTSLVVKDRVLAHNPIGAVYGCQGYFKKALFEDHKRNS
jgi:uncharacterized metal-binding protein